MREMESEIIKDIMNKLDGYLCAMSDLNDVQEGMRHSFSAETIEHENDDVYKSIRDYLEDENAQIREIDLNEELYIIERYILNNYLFGTSDPKSKEQSYIKNLHGWRIQEYVTLASDYYEEEERRWVVEHDDENLKASSIFILP